MSSITCPECHVKFTSNSCIGSARRGSIHNAVENFNVGTLAPGEWAQRQLNAGDTTARLFMAAPVGVVSGVLTALAVNAAGWWATGGWYAVAGVPVVVIGGVYVWLIWPHLKHDADAVQVKGRYDEPEVAQLPAPQTITSRHITAEVRNGRQTIYTDFFIESEQEFYDLCRNVQEGCNFSKTQARTCGVKGFAEILTEWDRRGLIEKGSTIGTKTPKLTRAGRALVRRFADTPPAP